MSATAESDVQLTIGATGEALAKGLDDAKRQIDDWAKEAVAKLNQAGAGAGRAGESVKGLGNTIKAFARDQRSEARAAGFFVEELSHIIPVGNSAKNVLTNLGGALVGGGIVGIAIAAATSAVALLTEAWREEAKAAEEAAKKEKEAAEKRDQATKANLFTALEFVEKLQLQKKGLDDELAGRAKLTTAEERAVVQKMKVEAAMMGQGAQQAALNKRIREAVELLDEIDRLERAKAARGFKTDVTSVDASTKPHFSYNMAPGGPRVGVTVLKSEEEDRIKRAGKLVDIQQILADKARETAMAYMQWGDAAGQTFALVATGQATVAEGFASIISLVIEAAKKWIMAEAAAAAASAAKSQSGIPVFGPILAGTAMVATLSMVQGLLGQVGKASSGYRVPDWVGPGGVPTVLHPGEHVLPKRIAKNYEAGGGGGGPTFNFNGPIFDGDHLYRTLRRNDSALIRVFRDLQREGRI